LPSPHDAVRRALARAREQEFVEFLVRKGVLTPDRLVESPDEGGDRPLHERIGLSPDRLAEIEKEFANEAFEQNRTAIPPEPEEVREARRRGNRAIGGYLLVQSLASGALSEVWKAWDPSAGRWVALKTLHGATAQRDVLDRWRREAAAGGRLFHPNIVPVHAVGDEEGRPWIAMAYVPGTSLEERPSSRDEIVRILRIVALAVHHAHTQGVVHRDLKPSNIIIDSSGNPWVCDFGIAQVFDAPRLTAPGTILGTAPYMAPERTIGGDPADPAAADVYGLGATLYALAVGRPPYGGESFLSILKKVQTEDPPRPSRLVVDFPPDLERIILKAMARDPRHRYASAAALAEDLARLAQGRPAEARPPPNRRSRGRLALLGAAALAAAATAFLLLLPGRSPEVPIRILESARQEIDLVQEALYDAAIPDGEFASRLARARELVERALKAAPGLALAHHRRGEIAEVEGQFEEARRAWERALACDPAFAAAQYRLGRTLLVQAYLRRLNLWNEPEALIRSDADRLARAAAARLDDARAGGFENALYRQLAYAMGLYLRNEAVQATEACDRGIQDHGRRRGAEEFLWLKGLTTKDRVEARALFDRAIELRPRYALAFFSRGLLIQGEGRSVDAMAEFEAALRASSAFGEARLYRGSARAFAGDDAGAVADFEALLEDPRLAPGAFNGRGFVRRRSGDPEGALADFTEAIRRMPDRNALAYVYRAELRLERKDFKAAAEDARRAYSLHPWSWSLHLLLQARAALRDWAGAEADLDALGVPADDEARRSLRSLRGNP
jgi:tetratricopeptide (TPR) repeat protein